MGNKQVSFYNHKITKFHRPRKLIQKIYANVYVRKSRESKSPRKFIFMCIFSKQIPETIRLPAFSEILFFKIDEQKRESEF